MIQEMVREITRGVESPMYSPRVPEVKTVSWTTTAEEHLREVLKGVMEENKQLKRQIRCLKRRKRAKDKNRVVSSPTKHKGRADSGTSPS